MKNVPFFVLGFSFSVKILHFFFRIGKIFHLFAFLKRNCWVFNLFYFIFCFVVIVLLLSIKAKIVTQFYCFIMLSISHLQDFFTSIFLIT